MCDKTNEVSSEEFLINENSKLRDAGCNLAEAASRVVHNYDGIHRLSLAISDWYKTLADEGGRDERN